MSTRDSATARYPLSNIGEETDMDEMDYRERGSILSDIPETDIPETLMMQEDNNDCYPEDNSTRHTSNVFHRRKNSKSNKEHVPTVNTNRTTPNNGAHGIMDSPPARKESVGVHAEIVRTDCKPRERSMLRSLKKKVVRLISTPRMITSNTTAPRNEDVGMSMSESVQLSRRSVQTLSFTPGVASRELSGHLSSGSDSDDEPVFETTTQFRLSNNKPSNAITSRVLAFLGITTADDIMYDDAGGSANECSCCGFEPNKLVTRYLHWTFRRSFLAVFVSLAVGFFGLTILFALVLLADGQYHPECHHVNGENFSNYTNSDLRRDFGDAYALSWTTFSTVGYGLVFPATSTVHRVKGTQVDCAGIMIICCIESFVGILFASFCGAIMIGKVARVRSHAQVVFSSAMIIRYGVGLMAEEEDDGEDHSIRSMISRSDSGNATDEESPPMHRELPCPVLEFRIANRMHSTASGEIMDCSMNIVASIDAEKADHALRGAAGRRRRRRGKRKSNARVGKPAKQPLKQASRRNSTESLESLAESLREGAKKTRHAFEEDPLGMISSKRIFSKLEVETPDHPFFKRVWIARHTLDLESPILADDAKQAIRLNNGFWPNELNDAESVRACINFDQILVSLSGTSNADANSVYAQKVYAFHDLKIGYRFASMIYRDHNGDGSLKVDMDLINHVEEQVGGGGEKLQDNESHAFKEMLIL